MDQDKSNIYKYGGERYRSPLEIVDNTVLQYHRNVRDNKVKKYKFSVIMAVYNVEEYIEEAMQSILDQTIGFEHIQVIMVDDCSTDNSASI